MLRFPAPTTRGLLTLAVTSLMFSPLSSGGVSAASKTGGFAVRGVGAQTCADIRAELEGEAAQAAVQVTSAWIAGYVSQYNRLSPETYETMPIIDNTVVARLALDVCRANPDKLFETVAATLISSLRDGALSNESDVIEVGQNGVVVSLRRGVFQKVQLALIERGVLSPGAADGQYGPRSRAALIEFQKSRGMTESGLPDPATLVVLFALGETAGETDNTQ